MITFIGASLAVMDCYLNIFGDYPPISFDVSPCCYWLQMRLAVLLTVRVSGAAPACRPSSSRGCSHWPVTWRCVSSYTWTSTHCRS